MIRSSSDRTRTTPSRLNTASMTASSPVSAPVWACAVCWAVSLRPTLRATIGLPAASARRAAAANSAGCRMDSRNSAMTRVAGSSTRCSTTSVTDSMDSLPIATSRLMPRLRAWARLSTALARPPLCSTTPTGPRSSGTGMGSP